MSFFTRLILILCLLINSGHFLFAQEVKLELGKKTITLNDFFTVTISAVSDNNSKPDYSSFPNIKNLKKVGSPTLTVTTIGGLNSVTQTISQRYKATKEGIFNIQSFSITVNKKIISSEAMVLSVIQPKESDQTGEVELYEEMLKSANTKQEFVDVKEDAFFALTIDKDEVYIGEGFTVTLALYVAESNKADIDSYKQSEQLAKIINKLKPANCWEEDFGIREYQAVPIILNKKKYATYTFYRASFYPLNTSTITFPKVGLTMIKYKIAKEETDEKQATYTTFFTQEQSVNVKNLPSHPLMEKISVGNFRLEEEITSARATTGRSFKYIYKITGEGNVSAINLPVVASDSLFDFFPPQINQTIGFFGNQETGLKTSTFQIIPKKAGVYQLKNYFNWIFFNVKTSSYDTLRSGIKLTVHGSDLQNINLSTEKLDPVYEDILKPNQDININLSRKTINTWGNIGLLVLLLAVMVITFVKN